MISGMIGCLVYYAGAIEQLAKTDKIDAAVIAEYAAVVQPKPTPRKSKT